MRQNSTLKKVNSHLCVIDTLKFRTCYLIMRHKITRSLVRALGIHTCDCRYVRTRCHIQQVPQLPKWPLLQLTTSIYIGSSTAYVVTMYTSGSGKYPTIGEILGTVLASGTTRTIATLWRCWRRIRVVWLSFRLSRTPWLRSIVDFVTCLNCASQILIMRHRAPCRILIYARVTLQK